MHFIKDFKSNLTLDAKTFKPFNEISFNLDTENVQDSRSMLQDDEIAKILGKQILKAVAEANKKQVDEGTVGTKKIIEINEALNKPEPQVAKFSIITKIARQVEGEYVFVDIVKAHKDTDKLRKFLSDNELPRTEVMGETPCVIEYGVLEDIEVNVD